jgi:CelD/BcsL family acetyltransferase involved in cellulose biosynthesis
MTDFHVCRITELTDADWALWRELAQQPVYESPYFCPEFAQAVASVRSDVEVAILREGGRAAGFFPFQRGKLNLGKPLGGKLSDYHGPLVRPGTQFDPRTLLAACRLASWDFDHLVAATTALEPFISARAHSPQMDLSAGFASYARGRREAGSDTVHRQAQKTRKFAREVGPLAFEYDADDEHAFELLRAWKSAQLAASGLADVFAFPWTNELLVKLRATASENFSTPLSVLRTGDRVAAVCLSLRSRGVLHSWFTAYDPELKTYSPGLALFVRLAEEAEQLGIRKIDLGRGDERYKASLATGTVVLGEGSVSSRSLATILRTSWRQTRDWVARSPLAGSTRLPGRLLKPLREWLAYH